MDFVPTFAGCIKFFKTFLFNYYKCFNLLYNNFKFNLPSSASGVEVTHKFETTKACGFNAGRELGFLFFCTIFCLFILLRFDPVSRILFF